MSLAAAQPIDQPAIDRAEGQFPGFGALARVRNLVKDPADLGAGEVWIEHQSGARRDVGRVPGRCQSGAGIRGPSALPDDGRSDGDACSAIPDNSRFPLIRNSYAVEGLPAAAP